MKKLYAMLAAAVAVSFSANAQLEYTNVALANPSFEEEAADFLPHVHGTGWEFVGDAWYNADNTAGSGLFDMQNHNKNPSDGVWVMRSSADVACEPGTYMKQTIFGQKPGTYVLIYDGQATRNNWQGTNEDGSFEEGAFAAAFISDDEGDFEGDCLEEEPTLGTSCLYIHNEGSGAGNKWFWLSHHVLVHTTHPDLEDETGITIGYGVPTNSAAISKCRLAADNFQLRFYDTMDKDAVIAQLTEEIKEIEANGMLYGDPANGKTYKTIGTNFGEWDTMGVNDITVAPEFVGNNKYYNLQGIEVADPTQPGLYIHNGKKILVK